MTLMTRRAALTGLASLASAPLLPAIGLAQGGSLAGWGVVLIHGKAGGTGPLNAIDRQLKSAGAVTTIPRMSWASSYRTYDETLAEVARAIAAVRAQGARKVALAGHSLGANVSLGYAAKFGGVDAVIAMAPGHRPEFIVTVAGDSLARAKGMVAAGRGGERARFTDFNQGQTYEITTTAAAYDSFFDPDGPAHMSRTAGRVRAPILWLIGSDDRPAQRVPVGGRTITIAAGHRDTPTKGAGEVVAWLSGR